VLQWFLVSILWQRDILPVGSAALLWSIGAGFEDLGGKRSLLGIFKINGDDQNQQILDE
jgi:hypothetical protein